jgi:hypothetical protein
MRRLSLVLLVAASAACGSSTDNSKPSSPYSFTVVSQVESGGGANPYLTTLTLEVSLKEDGTVQPGVTIITQVSVGDVAPLPMVTGANGQATVTWTIQPADQSAGRSESLAYCAPPPGSAFCDTKLFGPNSITVTF